MNLIAPAFIGILATEIFLHLPFQNLLSAITAHLNKSLSTIRSPRISDHWKERVILKYSLIILTATLKSAFYIGVILAPIGLLAFINEGFLATITSFSGIITLSAVSIIYFIWRKKMPQGPYGPLSKAFHYLALGSHLVCEASFDIEQTALRPDPADIINKKHVFIAGLARAGTTLLMRRFYATGQFRSLTYRDMPFVLMPNLWRKLSSFSHKQSVKQERAHGDGLLVDYNSPEALEEVFWKTFSENDYIQPDKLVPMTADDEVLGKFRSYVSSILSQDPRQNICYLSKNNNNILRLSSIHQAFPRALIIIPFRDPLQQADSLLSQHRRFVGVHQTDTFICQYMRWLAHHEFGYDHRPFRFDPDRFTHTDPRQLNYWLERWVDAYRWLMVSAPPAAVFLSYESFCSKIDEIWPQLSAMADIPCTMLGEDLIVPKNRRVKGKVDEAISKEAYKTYEELLSKEIRGNDSGLRENLSSPESPLKN